MSAFYCTLNTKYRTVSYRVLFNLNYSKNVVVMALSQHEAIHQGRFFPVSYTPRPWKPLVRPVSKLGSRFSSVLQVMSQA